MKFFLFYTLIAVLPICTIASISSQPEIQLPKAQDSVIPGKLRTSIIEAAELSLNRSDETFFAIIEKVENPYPANKRNPSVRKHTPEESFVVYDDASVLELIQLNFSPQVMGTLAKGETNYLQLNGGGLLEEGDSFPVQIPQIEGKTFIVNVLKITTRGYTLQMNDVVQEVTFEKHSGITKDSEK